MDIYKEIRRLQLDGVTSQRAAAKLLGISRNTVRKYWEGETVPWDRKSYERNALVVTPEVVLFVKACLDEDEAEGIKKQQHTARRIYERLGKERGFKGAESTIRSLVHNMKAERKARLQANIESTETATEPQSAHVIDALIPLLVLIFGTIIGLVVTGYDASLWNGDSGFFSKLSVTIGAANSYLALLWASLLSLITSIVMTLLRGTLPFSKVMEEMVEGFKTMLNAVLILTMAWSIALVTKDMHTAEFVSQLLLKWSLSPAVVPVLTFVLAAFIGFSTGTSWGTMAILYPLILPASWMLCQSQGLSVDATMPLFYNVVASVLAGSVMGDHCSPISDTTIMSSLASGCNHLEHVRTQIPYALVVGGVAVLIGVLPTALGLPSWVAFLMGFVVLGLIVRLVGKKVET